MDPTDIRTSADAEESLRKTELEDARRLRFKWLDSDENLSCDLADEISGGWLLGKEEATTHELQEALVRQRHLCAELTTAKKTLINDFQQELKQLDEQYVGELKKQAAALDQMKERIREQPETLAKIYAEELEQIESVYQLEYEIDRKKFEMDKVEYMKERWDLEENNILQRKTEVEKYEANLNNLLTTTHFPNHNNTLTRMFDLERDYQHYLSRKIVRQVKHDQNPRIEFANMKNRMSKLVKELYTFRPKIAQHKRDLQNTEHALFKEYEKWVERFERTEMTIRQLAHDDARKFQKMKDMLQSDVKDKVERALEMDSLICGQLLGLSWERPRSDLPEAAQPVSLQHRDLTEELMNAKLGRAALDPRGPRRDPGAPRHSANPEAQEAFWEIMGNSISEERLRQWDTVENTLRKYMKVLRDVSDLIPEIKDLTQHNSELQRLMQQKEPDTEMDEDHGFQQLKHMGEVLKKNIDTYNKTRNYLVSLLNKKTSGLQEAKKDLQGTVLLLKSAKNVLPRKVRTWFERSMSDILWDGGKEAPYELPVDGVLLTCPQTTLRYWKRLDLPLSWKLKDMTELLRKNYEVATQDRSQLIKRINDVIDEQHKVRKQLQEVAQLLEKLAVPSLQAAKAWLRRQGRGQLEKTPLHLPEDWQPMGCLENYAPPPTPTRVFEVRHRAAARPGLVRLDAHRTMKLNRPLRPQLA